MSTDERDEPDGPSAATLTRTGESAEAPRGAMRSPYPLASVQVRDPERYQILGEHGRGGLGRVSRAHDRELGRDVAIKELIERGHLGELRFTREALITARLEHPGIVAVHEAGRWPDGTPFYAMKLVSGRSLRDLIAERATVEQRITLLHHVIAVADAIAYAHGRNIIHRDLKPANVIVGDFGETVVIDWGLAKDLSVSEEVMPSGSPFRTVVDPSLTATGSILGTPAYMPPEQKRGEDVDQRADVFAIGAMLWELCSLQKVPPADPDLRHRVLRRAGIDGDLATIIDKALDPDPERRYPHAGALAADLKAFKSGARIAARTYSLPAMLAHWTRRHRALALSVVTALTVAIGGSALFIRNIAAARDNAEAQRRLALIASARSQMERDPTQAWSTISALSADTSPELAILRGRIKARTVADDSLTFSESLIVAVMTSDAKHLIVASRERALFAIDLRSHALRKLAGDLAEPVVFGVSNTHVYVVRRLEHLTLTRVAIASGQTDDLLTLQEQPLELSANEEGVFWQDNEGSVHEYVSDHSSRVVATHVAEFMLIGRKIALCSHTNELTIGDVSETPGSGGVRSALGRCMSTWDWGASGGRLAVPVDPSTLGVYDDGAWRHVPFARSGTPIPLQISDTGLIVAIDEQANGAFLRPGADAFEHVRSTPRAMRSATRGSKVGWGFADGTVKILDIERRREWSFKADAQLIGCLELLPGDQLVTCSINSFRFWSLRSDVPVLAAELPATASNVTIDASGTAIFDGYLGDVLALDRGALKARPLHKHRSTTFGVAWCGARACSAGWDGQVLCSDADGTATSAPLALVGSVRWLDGGAGRCFAASFEGSIYDLQSAATPIYRHDREPFRLVVSPDGRWVASNDWGGTVTLWNADQRRVAASKPRLHRGRIMNMVWVDGRLVTAGSDGIVRILDLSLKEQKVWHVGGPVRFMQASSTAVSAALADGTVWSTSLETGIERRVPIGGNVTALAITADRPDIAVGTDDGDLIVVDERSNIVAYQLGSGAVSCLAFADAQTILACMPARVMRVDVGGDPVPLPRR